MRFAMLLLVAGCRSIFGIQDPAIATADANIDAASDATDGNGCASFSSLFDTCTLPPGVVMPGSTTAYSTDSGIATVGNDPVPLPHMVVATALGSIDVVSVTSFVQDADGMLRITGTLPVAFAVTGEVNIPGRIDVSAGGAGTGCDATGTGANGVVQGTAGDGGGGGGNVELGGNGGGGDNHPTLTHGGGTQPVGLHGGCAGGRSGGSQGFAGGLGGGAVYLVAASPIVITGVIDASGGGGKGGGAAHAGGGGGGAGGLVMLEASGVDVEGQLDATGGGGGGGADTLEPGQPGKLGSAGGNGGNGSSGNLGGRGGNGVASANAGTGGVPEAGGGGGGGGVGRITITSPGFVNGGSVAPPPS